MIVKYALVFFLSLSLSPSYGNESNVSNSQVQVPKSALLPEHQVNEQKEKKVNNKGEPILSRKIAPTDSFVVSNKKQQNNTQEIELKNTESKKNVADSKLSNITTKATQSNSPAPRKNATEITPTVGKNHSENTTKTVASQNATLVASKSTTTSTTTTTTTTTTSTTTTTPKPKKPTITYSVDDMPEIANIAPQHSSNSKLPSSSNHQLPNKLSVDEPEQPNVQPSQELDSGLYRKHRDYIIPIVSIIFAVPILMGMVIVTYRRLKDFWSTRHYRRMDFLVDGMYND